MFEIKLKNKVYTHTRWSGILRRLTAYSVRVGGLSSTSWTQRSARGTVVRAAPDWVQLAEGVEVRYVNE